MQDYLDEFLPKNKLDYAIEHVEDKYGSLREAPMSAIYWIRETSLPKNDKKYGAHSKRGASGRIPYNPSIKVKCLHGTWYTNSKHLVAAGNWVNEGRSIRIASQLGGISLAQFRQLGVLNSFYVYTYKHINFKFRTYSAMFNDFKAMNWIFAPNSIKQVRNRSYRGHLKKTVYCKDLKYKRDLE